MAHALCIVIEGTLELRNFSKPLQGHLLAAFKYYTDELQGS